MKITLYAFYEQYDWENEGRFIFWHVKVEDTDYRFFIKEVVADLPELDLPSREQVARMKVTALESERQAILAETHQKVAMIEEKIRQLSAITYQGE